MTASKLVGPYELAVPLSRLMNSNSYRAGTELQRVWHGLAHVLRACTLERQPSRHAAAHAGRGTRSEIP